MPSMQRCNSRRTSSHSPPQIDSYTSLLKRIMITTALSAFLYSPHMQTEQTVAIISSKNVKSASFQDNCNGSVECFALGESVEITSCPEFSAATFVVGLFILLLRLPATQVCYTESSPLASSALLSSLQTLKKTEQTVAIASKLLPLASFQDYCK